MNGTLILVKQMQDRKSYGRLKSRNVWLDNVRVVGYTKIVGIIDIKLKTLRTV